MGDLVPGQRVGLGSASVSFRMEGPRLSQHSHELGAMLVALDPARQVAPAFPPLDIGAREMRPGASYGPQGSLELDLASVPPSVDRFLLILHIMRGPGQGITFRDFESIAVVLGEHRFTLDLTSRGEAALIMVEVYRRGSDWRVTASGQGFVGGLNALRSALNIDIPVPHYPDRGGGGGHGGGHDPFDRRRPPPPPGSTFSGSGFAVDAHHILTNAHVIDGAVKVDVASDKLTAPAEIIFTDPRNDIALLRVERSLTAAARFRDPADLHLGEDIVVLGFPLQGLLGSGPQATAGNVSALCGIGNDTSVMQFSAPIASGNSGGPILDQSGLVVGLVHSSLNKERVREEGSNAENVNFGAKAALIRAFLGTVGIDPQLAAHAATRSRAEIVREARAYIYRVRCEA